MVKLKQYDTTLDRMKTDISLFYNLWDMAFNLIRLTTV